MNCRPHRSAAGSMEREAVAAATGPKHTLAGIAAIHCPSPLWICAASGLVLWANHAAGELQFEPTPELVEQLLSRSADAKNAPAAPAEYEFTACPVSDADTNGDESLVLVAAERRGTTPVVVEPLDAVTGVLSRAALDNRLAKWVGPTGPRHFALCFIDIDDFKSVNDRHGHPAADRALAAIASRLQAVLRTGDIVARYGGDEMVLLVAGVESAEQWSAVEQRLQAALNEPHEFEATDEQISCSVGVAFFDRVDPTSAADLLREADRRMYESKRA